MFYNENSNELAEGPGVAREKNIYKNIAVLKGNLELGKDLIHSNNLFKYNKTNQ